MPLSVWTLCFSFCMPLSSEGRAGFNAEKWIGSIGGVDWTLVSAHRRPALRGATCLGSVRFTQSLDIAVLICHACSLMCSCLLSALFRPTATCSPHRQPTELDPNWLAPSFSPTLRRTSSTIAIAVPFAAQCAHRLFALRRLYYRWLCSPAWLHRCFKLTKSLFFQPNPPTFGMRSSKT